LCGGKYETKKNIGKKKGVQGLKVVHRGKKAKKSALERIEVGED